MKVGKAVLTIDCCISQFTVSFVSFASTPWHCTFASKKGATARVCITASRKEGAVIVVTDPFHIMLTSTSTFSTSFSEMVIARMAVGPCSS